MNRLSRFDLVRYRPLVRAVMDQAGVVADPEDWEIHENGSAHTVIDVGHRLSVRIAKNHAVAQRVQRRTDLLRALPHDLPFETPRPLTRAIRRGGMTGVGLSWVPGAPREPGPAPARTLGRTLRGITGIDFSGLEPYLDPPHAHWGGSDWAATLRDRVIPLLHPGFRTKARRYVDEAAALEPVAPALIHGDFAGHNILWTRDRITGIIDWDHAAVSDPAWDIASAANCFGWEPLLRCVGRDWTERAKVLHRLLPLQAVGYAVVGGRSGALLDQAVDRANARLDDRRP